MQGGCRLSLNCDSSVKDLQTLLFPVSPRRSDSFLSNFFLKSTASATEIEEEHLEQIVRFKDPKEFTARDADCPSQPPRWPTECQVLEEKIEHIDHVPAVSEAYYVPTGKEVQPKPVGEECGIVVYQYYPISAVNYFSRSSVGGSRYLLPTCPCPEEDCLRFESRFESGNLAKAIKITATYYELYLRTDLYTNKHTQWFYFRITNMRKNVMYRFSIVNLAKEESLFNEGMKVLMYSEKDAQMHSIGWRRCGDNITYFSNENVGPDEPEQPLLYTLSFTLEFPHDDDTVYFAHSYPYTYSDLQKYLQEMTSHPVKSTFSNLRLLCRTLAGNNVYYITITTPQVPGDNRKKPAIVITSRVHPGESPASWIMKGFLDFLTGDSGPAKELRDKFIFKLVPMLNPDGVIVGNNRCSLTGRDLNRQYRTVIRETYPSIWYTKLMIRRLLEECGVAMYCDLHAHSRKHNIFIYGCENRRGLDKRLHEQVFPLMLHKNAADKFSFENCKFRVQKCKEGTGRVVMWMMGIANSFTMEASFGGSTLSTRAETHFTTQDYEQMGKSFCQTLLDFYDDDPRKERLRLKIINRLVKEGSNADEPTNIQLSDYSSDSGDTSSSSEEGGGRDYEIPLIVPPPSPAITKRSSKPKPPPSAKLKQPPKSPNAQRKPLPMFKANLEISISQEKICYTSDSNSSNTDSECDEKRDKSKYTRRRRRKKKVVKKTQHIVQNLEYSDSEVQLKKSTERCISVLELLPETKIRSQSWHRNTRTTQSKPFYDNRRSTTQQLAEVQAKLISLRNKLWFGIGDSEYGTPLSWGDNSFCVYTSGSPQVQIKNSNTPIKPLKKKTVKLEKEKKAITKKHKETSKDKVQKKEKHTVGFRRQTTIEWVSLNNMSEKLKKLKTLSDTTAKFQKLVKGAVKTDSIGTVKCEPSEKADESKQKQQHKKKKKKKITNLGKTAKSVTNANIFIKRD